MAGNTRGQDLGRLSAVLEEHDEAIMKLKLGQIDTNRRLDHLSEMIGSLILQQGKLVAQLQSRSCPKNQSAKLFDERIEDLQIMIFRNDEILGRTCNSTEGKLHGDREVLEQTEIKQGSEEPTKVNRKREEDILCSPSCDGGKPISALLGESNLLFGVAKVFDEIPVTSKGYVLGAPMWEARDQSLELTHHARTRAYRYSSLQKCNLRLGDSNNRFQLGLEEVSGIKDEYTFSNAIKGCLLAGDINYGRELHGLIVRRQLGFSTSTSNALLGVYLRAGRRDSASKLFNMMREKDIITWNTIFLGFFVGDDARGFVPLFHKFMIMGMKPNGITFSILLKRCGDISNILLGLQFCCLLLHSGFLGDAKVTSSLISMFSKCGAMHMAQSVFDCTSSKSTGNLNELISGFSLNFYYIEALQVFCHSLELGVEFDECTFSSILESCCRLGNETIGRQIHCATFKFGFSYHGYVCSSLIKLYATVGRGADAFQCLRELKKSDLACWGTLVSTLVHHGRSNEAISSLKCLMESGDNPDEFTLGSIFNACANMASLHQTKSSHSLAAKMGYGTNTFVASSIIDAYAKCEDNIAILLFGDAYQKTIKEYEKASSIFALLSYYIWKDLRGDFSLSILSPRQISGADYGGYKEGNEVKTFALVTDKHPGINCRDPRLKTYEKYSVVPRTQHRKGNIRMALRGPLEHEGVYFINPLVDIKSEDRSKQPMKVFYVKVLKEALRGASTVTKMGVLNEVAARAGPQDMNKEFEIGNQQTTEFEKGKLSSLRVSNLVRRLLRDIAGGLIQYIGCEKATIFLIHLEDPAGPFRVHATSHSWLVQELCGLGDFKDRVQDQVSRSTKAQGDSSVPKNLLESLSSKPCVALEILVQPFQAHIQFELWIYSMKIVSARRGYSELSIEMDGGASYEFEMGHESTGGTIEWTYMPLGLLLMVQENYLQMFELLEQVLYIGGILLIVLLGEQFPIWSKGRVEKRQMRSSRWLRGQYMTTTDIFVVGCLDHSKRGRCSLVGEGRGFAGVPPTTMTSAYTPDLPSKRTYC